MKRYALNPIERSIYCLEKDGCILGYVVKGELLERRDGSLFIRGKRWIVLGYEYCSFRSFKDAADALFQVSKNLKEAKHDVEEVRRLETFLPLVRKASRRAAKKSYEKRLRKKVKRQISDSRQDYIQSLERSGRGSGTFTTKEMLPA